MDVREEYYVSSQRDRFNFLLLTRRTCHYLRRMTGFEFVLLHQTFTKQSVDGQ